jgi:hypothetical protein
MNKLLNLKSLIGLVLICVGLFLPLTKVDNDPILLNINKPTQEILEIVQPLSNIITDPTDRAKFAIFNQEFANRVKGYNTDIQQLNDVYVLAGSSFFQDSIKDKYKDLDIMIVDLIKQSVTDDNHTLTNEEKEKLSSNFMGLAWSLIQKR